MRGEIKEELIESFKNGTTLTKLIYINLGVFLVISIAQALLGLFNINTEWVDSLMLPAQVSTFAHRPWSILTYMFFHKSFIHILFNLLMLYWFGKLFLQYCSQHDLVGLYILGGIAGGATYIIAFNLLPKFAPVVGLSMLLGASASVMAITIATAVFAPNQTMRLVLIGDVKIKWIALVSVLISLMQINAENAGGELAHIGGAIAGYIFAIEYKKGKNITDWINNILHRAANLIHGAGRKPKMKVSHTNMESDQEYNYRKKQENDEIDKILDKIKSSGYESLSDDEKGKLFGKKR
ncbi:MAG: rhomboid family intramembrane serine protease [Paludibacteraceae bacterium]|nr:rhomboid family intramembrane serine protease [Paludibacteraceae bacterium]